jgi:hypothetical protein
MATSFECDILLLDEWIGAGDDQFQAKASKRMDALVERSGITVIASHRRTLLQKVCNLGLWLDGGHQRAFGPINEVLEAMDAAQTERAAPQPRPAPQVETQAPAAETAPEQPAAPVDPLRLFRQRIDDLKTIRNALESYRADHGGYPDTENAWISVAHRQTLDWFIELVPQYLSDVPRDPLSTWMPEAPQYLYKSNGIGYKLIAHKTGDAELVSAAVAVRRDPKRTFGTACWAYGYWTSDYQDQ